MKRGEGVKTTTYDKHRIYMFDREAQGVCEVQPVERLASVIQIQIVIRDKPTDLEYWNGVA